MGNLIFQKPREEYRFKNPLSVVEIEKGSIRTMNELRDVVQRKLIPETPIGHALAVRRGAIDRASFPISDLSIIDADWRSGSFHTHNFDVVLVSEDNVVIHTLVTEQQAFVQALIQLSQCEEWRKEAARMSRLGNHFTTMTAMVLDNDRIDSDQVFASYCNWVKSVFSNKIIDLLHGIQISMGINLTEIRWNLYDLCLLRKRCVHARDMRSGHFRKETELRSLKLNRRKSKNE